MIASESLRCFAAALKPGGGLFYQNMCRAAKLGDCVMLRDPVSFDAANFATIQNWGVTETTTPVILQFQIFSQWRFELFDLTWSLDEYAERRLKPAAWQLAQGVDARRKTTARTVCSNLGLPSGVDSAYSVDCESIGLALRFVRVYDAPRDEMICRLDFLFGADELQPGVRSGIFNAGAPAGIQLSARGQRLYDVLTDAASAARASRAGAPATRPRGTRNSR